MFSEDFSIFKKLCKTKTSSSPKYVLSLSSTRFVVKHILPSNTALASTALTPKLCCGQRSMIEVMCVHRSSYLLFPASKVEYQFACN